MYRFYCLSLCTTLHMLLLALHAGNMMLFNPSGVITNYANPEAIIEVGRLWNSRPNKVHPGCPCN